MTPLILKMALIGAPMPQIPFDTVDPVLGRTIHVKASCAVDIAHSMVLLASDTIPLDTELTAALMRAFRTDGVTIINVCRIGVR